MTPELMLEIAKEAKLNRERNSDISLSFQEVENRLKFDQAAEKLILVLVVKRLAQPAMLAKPTGLRGKNKPWN